MTIGLIGAMDEEIKLLKETMANPKTEEIASMQFITGTIAGRDVVLLKSDIGKANAAIGTTLLNYIFSPRCIINTGSAGGLRQDLNVGDVVISSAVVYHDVDVTAFGYDYGQIPKMPTYYEPDQKLVAIAEKCAQFMDSRVIKGVIASGDTFMNDAKRIEEVRKQFPDVCAVEMEAAAIAQVCYRFQVPFVIIRSLSDIAGKNAEVTFKEYLKVASENSAQQILLMIEEL